jgi:hypothetical protein
MMMMMHKSYFFAVPSAAPPTVHQFLVVQPQQGLLWCSSH